MIVVGLVMNKTHEHIGIDLISSVILIHHAIQQ